VPCETCIASDHRLDFHNDTPVWRDSTAFPAYVSSSIVIYSHGRTSTYLGAVYNLEVSTPVRITWRSRLHLVSITALFAILGACVVLLIYAAGVLYGFTGYVAIAGITLFLVAWRYIHRD
jgi:hypothetical protein